MVEPALPIQLVAVLPELEAATPEAAIERLGGLLRPSGGEAVAAELAAAVLQRERVASTYLGHETALPHCRLGSVRELQVVLARARAGIPWGPRGERARLVWLSAIPPHAGAVYLALLQAIARAVRDEAVRAAAFAAADEPALRGWVARHIGAR